MKFLIILFIIFISCTENTHKDNKNLILLYQSETIEEKIGESIDDLMNDITDDLNNFPVISFGDGS